ncbi:PAS domain-containing sensor histidine kinase, partial [bacterium]|nr:PAS domain-containing sensor histidine kinase [bacterium]
QQQAELIHQNKFLEAILNSLSDGLVIIDSKNKILRATPKISQWFGLKGKELLRKNILDFIEIIDKDISLDKMENTEIYIKGFSEDAFEASTMKLQLEDKRKRFIVIIKNVTNQKEIEHLKDDFVSTLTHDLKVPIIAEANILDFLVEEKFGPLSDKQKEAIKNIQVSNKELIELVQILLETYKMKDSGEVMYFETFEINPFINEIVKEMTPIAEKGNLKIRYKEYENISITADKIQLKRVIKNLLHNAIQHSESEKNIDITVLKTQTDVNISVIDYGKGIAKEDLEMVFKKYYSTAKKFRKIGTGLGLYLAQQIIKSHGGEITVQSSDGEGTTFSIHLPYKSKVE